MLKIYGTTASSNVQKVLWCCGELALAYQRLDIGETFGGLKSPGYLALNPNGLMPTIDDDGFVLWESNVIVRYLASRHGSGTLYPSDLRARGDADRWMDWQQTTLNQPMGVLFRMLLRKSEPAEPTALGAARAKASASWEILDRALADRAYVGGNQLTIGDVALGNAIHRWYKLPIDHPRLDRLQAWYQRLNERPAYRQHIAAF
ncbi:MAG TPA: glutathione S-transferase family protein [Casimicrobiaceae bacterium]|nr:glutathione S-transferase family protein [Casimicrobiaceae bacterium]